MKCGILVHTQGLDLCSLHWKHEANQGGPKDFTVLTMVTQPRHVGSPALIPGHLVPVIVGLTTVDL